MKLKKLAEKKWYTGAVIACIGVAFYVLLTNFGAVLSAVGGFLGNFKAVFLGIVFAYVLNPLANFFSRKVLRKMKPGDRRWVLAVILAVLTALLGLVFLIVVALGLCWGLINGFIVTKLHVPPFIATLGTQTIIYGISLVISDAQPIGGFQKVYTQLINGRIGESVKSFYLPYLFFVGLVFGLIFWVIYNKMRHGKYMYAIGGNDVAAEVSGVNTTRTLIRIYATAGIMYAIGGVSTTGGIGTVPGILVGVLVFELLKIILQFLGVNPYYNYVVQGLVIVLAVSLDIRKYIAKK